MTDNWIDVPGLEDRLQVTDTGRVRTKDYLAPSKRKHQPTQLRRGRELSPDLWHNGYYGVAVSRHGKRQKYAVHRLVALAFVDGWFEDATVDHLDGDRLNNAASNLEWVSRRENSRRQNAAGRGVPKGELHPCAKLSNAAVEQFRKLTAEGHSIDSLASMFGVSSSLLYLIKKGQRR